ncbi:MAG: BrnT family toxin [Synergistaceae bacterium]|nr:BrnT family toxin [Synergistaceae bacterium]
MPCMEYEPVKLVKKDFRFTWDEEKAKINLQKHGVSFYAAAGVFFDDNAYIGFNSLDRRTGEERFDITGKSESETMFVVYVERVTTEYEDVFRIISARRANRKEMERYVDGAE